MTDDVVEVLIARILRWGVTLSAALVLAGGIWYLLASGGQQPDYSHYEPVRGIGELLALPAPEIMILAGLLLLVATPVARVLFSVFAFAAERDRMYVACTLVVLAILVGSIIDGL